VEERVSTTVLCGDVHWSFPPPAGQHIYSCVALVSRFTARQGSLEASDPVFQSITGQIDPQWADRRIQLLIDGINENSAAFMAKLKALQERGLEVTKRMSDDFIAQSKRSGASMTGNFIGDIERKSRMADDWCDYALDLQKCQSPIDGSVRKTSSQYSYTWLKRCSHR
jgi:hypothetical protein